MALRPVEHKAHKGQKLTLDDIDAWVQDAKRSGAIGDEPVKVAVSLGGKIQGISIEIDTTGRMQKDSPT